MQVSEASPDQAGVHCFTTAAESEQRSPEAHQPHSSTKVQTQGGFLCIFLICK